MSTRFDRMVGRVEADPALPPRKEQAACCNARRDNRGRLPIGYCSPECERRPAGTDPR